MTGTFLDQVAMDPRQVAVTLLGMNERTQLFCAKNEYPTTVLFVPFVTRQSLANPKSMVLKSWPWVLLLGVFVLPGPRAGVFNGLPFDSVVEFLVLVFLLLTFGSRSTRKKLVDSLTKSSQWRRPLLVVAAAVLVLKVLGGLLTPTSGLFEACFIHARPAVESSVQDEACVKSFDVLPGLPIEDRTPMGITADFSVIDFGPRSDDARGLSGSNWNLAHVNASRYDRGYFPWEPADFDIESFAFKVILTGQIDAAKSDSLTVSYVGEGMVTTESARVELPPSYESVQQVAIDLGDGDQELSIEFAFLNEQPNEVSPAGPYAELQVRDDSGQLTTARSPTVGRAINLLVDVFTVVLLGLALFVCRRNLLSTRFLLPLIVVSPLILLERSLSSLDSMPLEPSVVALGVMMGLVAIGRLRNVGGVVVSAVLVSMHLVWIELESIAKYVVGSDYVVVRTRGNDQLVYRSFVQEMLNSGFFRGGEDVYYFQPGIRYVLYLFHLILGAGDVLVGISIVSLTFAAIVYFVRRLHASNRARSLLLASGGFAFVVWWSSSQTVQTMVQGLSESGTWPLLFIAFGLILRASSNPRIDLLVGALLGLLIWIRPNQGLAALALLAIWVVVVRSRESVVWKRLRAAAAFGGVLALLPIHNLLFGGRLVFLPGGHQNADQFGWLGIFEAGSNEAARQFYVEQLRGILYLPSVLPDIYSRKLGLAFALFALVFVAGLFSLIKSRQIEWKSSTLLILVLVGQIVPFLNFTVYRYFPVHVVAIQLVLAMVGLVFLSWSEGPREWVGEPTKQPVDT